MSIIEELLKSDTCNSNLDLNYTINSYCEAVEDAADCSISTKFTADNILFRPFENKYVCSIEDIERLMESTCTNLDDAIKEMKYSLEKCGCSDVNDRGLGVIVTKVDASDLMEACKKNGITANVKKKRIKKRTELLGNLKEKGVKIFKN